MVRRLETVGLRSINNVVDITNYALMETGQPLHVFDLDKLSGKKIIVRHARSQEPFFAIDHSEHKLDSQMLVIADAERAVALAGIMGGLNTEVTERTQNVLIESAEFEPVSIRRSARKLNLHSDSSYRFERKVDSVNIDWASRRAADLILQLAGGKLAEGVIDIWAKPYQSKPIKLRIRRIKDVLGIDVPVNNAVKILSALGFSVNFQGDSLEVQSLPHRADIDREIDLIEEIARIFGYGKVPIRDTISIRAVSESKAEKMSKIVHQALNQCGFSEAVTVTLVEPKQAALFTDVPVENILRVASSRRQANDALRCSLIPSLLAVRRLNQDAGNAVSDLYEIAHVFLPGQAGHLPNEYRQLALLSSRGELRAVRGALELMLKRLNSPQPLQLVPQPMPWFLPDQSAKILLGDREIGIVGTIHHDLQKMFDLKKPPAVAQLNYDMIEALPLAAVTSAPLPKFPAIERDLSIIVDETVRWEQIESAIRDLKFADLESIEFGELFRGKQIPKGQKSLFFTLRYRNSDRSLTHEEIDQYQQQVVTLMEKTFKAQLRAG